MCIGPGAGTGPGMGLPTGPPGTGPAMGGVTGPSPGQGFGGIQGGMTGPSPVGTPTGLGGQGGGLSFGQPAPHAGLEMAGRFSQNPLMMALNPMTAAMLGLLPLANRAGQAIQSAEQSFSAAHPSVTFGTQPIGQQAGAASGGQGPAVAPSMPQLRAWYMNPIAVPQHGHPLRQTYADAAQAATKMKGEMQRGYQRQRKRLEEVPPGGGY